MLAERTEVHRSSCLQVLGVLAGRPASCLSSEDVLRRMPLLSACVSETMRLHPPLSEIHRLAAQVGVDV